MFGAAAAYLGLAVLARWMGPSEFGIYSFALAWMMLLAIPMSLGLPATNVRFIPQYLASGDFSATVGLIRASWWLTCGAGLLLAGIGVATVLVLKAHLADHYVVPLIAALSGTVVVALATLQAERGGSAG